MPFLKRRVCNNWIKSIIKQHSFNVGDINYIFCSDNYLLQINNQYLKHDHFTDIITFNYNFEKTVSADIYISIDTVHNNCLIYKVPFDNELRRVMIHGVLHLLGFNDHTTSQKLEMTTKEDEALSIFYANFPNN
ncbi:MAG TPA: rRNA maturation RNase YbeY [Prolixibacteraceae bacterium]|nr:rRNA maturation RNase YbeY [Prolixibacteraceae bacterium]